LVKDYLCAFIPDNWIEFNSEEDVIAFTVFDIVEKELNGFV
jgi:hypothetical protein